MSERWKTDVSLHHQTTQTHKAMKFNEQVTADFTGMERASNQDATIIDRRMAPNGCGAEFIKADFVSATGHPYDAKDICCVVIEDGYAYIDNSYLKIMF